MSTQTQISSLAGALFLIGGVLLPVGRVLRIVDVQTLFDLSPALGYIASITGLAGGVLASAVGILALLGMKQLSSPSWNIILLILGLLVSSLGCILLFIESIMIPLFVQGTFPT